LQEFRGLQLRKKERRKVRTKVRTQARTKVRRKVRRKVGRIEPEMATAAARAIRASAALLTF